MNRRVITDVLVGGAVGGLGVLLMTEFGVLRGLLVVGAAGALLGLCIGLVHRRRDFRRRPSA